MEHIVQVSYKKIDTKNRILIPNTLMQVLDLKPKDQIKLECCIDKKGKRAIIITKQEEEVEEQ